jgi:site-specific DNA-adenine methylase
MIPSLIKVLDEYSRQLAHARVEARNEPAAPPRAGCQRTLVYLDPPYLGSTCYPDGRLDRDDVVALAEAWRSAGAAVMISEQHGLTLQGWRRERVNGGRTDPSPFRGKQAEWLTYTGGELEVAAAK